MHVSERARARRSRTATVVAALAGLLLSLVFPAGAQAVQRTVAPSGSPSGSPGDLVSAERVHVPGFALSARVWAIEYVSTDTHGAPVTVSGMVFVPRAGSDESRPIVGYAPGTHGLGDQCAPSTALRNGDDIEGALIGEYLVAGLAVAVTDYEGLGTPGDHAYMVARSAGQSLLDVVRAAQRLEGESLPDAGPVGLTGYSQGGHAASWAAQLAGTYAPELDLRGVAAGGTPVNLRNVAEANAGEPNFGLVLAAGIGMDTAYPELNLESYLNDAGRTAIEELRNSCDFSPYASTDLSDYTTRDPLAEPDWRSTLEAQNVGGVVPEVPMLLYHSTHDEIIPYQDANQLWHQWCAAGADVRFERLVLTEHAATAAVASPFVTTWMTKRLAGHPAHGNC